MKSFSLLVFSQKSIDAVSFVLYFFLSMKNSVLLFIQ